MGMKPKLGVHVSMTKGRLVAGGNSFVFFFSGICEFGLVNVEGGDWWAFDVIWVTILCLAFAMS